MAAERQGGRGGAIPGGGAIRGQRWRLSWRRRERGQLGGGLLYPDPPQSSSSIWARTSAAATMEEGARELAEQRPLLAATLSLPRLLCCSTSAAVSPARSSAASTETLVVTFDGFKLCLLQPPACLPRARRLKAGCDGTNSWERHHSLAGHGFLKLCLQLHRRNLNPTLLLDLNSTYSIYSPSFLT